MAEVSGRDEALQGEETWLPLASARLFLRTSLLPLLSAERGSCAVPGAPSLSLGPTAPSPPSCTPLRTPTRHCGVVEAVGGLGRGLAAASAGRGGWESLDLRRPSGLSRHVVRGERAALRCCSRSFRHPCHVFPAGVFRLHAGR